MDLNNVIKGKPGESAVLVLHDLSSQSVILTKRSEHLRHHPGEISFPGGTWDPIDHNLYTTALREVYEEMGIVADRITFIRELSVERTLLGDVIHPWLASIDSLEPYQLNDEEVDKLVIVPMELVKNPANYKEIMVDRRGYRIKSYQFMPSEEFIWGATARIMRQLAL